MTKQTVFVVALTLGLLAPALAQRNGPGPRGPAGRQGSLQVGDTAPDFTLKSPDGKSTVHLAELRNRQPVVLVFASYT